MFDMYGYNEECVQEFFDMVIRYSSLCVVCVFGEGFFTLFIDAPEVLAAGSQKLTQHRPIEVPPPP